MSDSHLQRIEDKLDTLKDSVTDLKIEMPCRVNALRIKRLERIVYTFCGAVLLAFVALLIAQTGWDKARVVSNPAIVKPDEKRKPEIKHDKKIAVNKISKLL